MTDTLPEVLAATASSTATEQNIRFQIDLARLRDAWQAVAGLTDDGSFTFVISASEVRLQASGELSVEGVVPISESSGFDVEAAIHLNLAEKSFAALGFGELPQHGSVILENLVAEAGFQGVLRLETDFTLQWPYTITEIGVDAITFEPSEGTPVDPRTIRSALGEIRDFAGTDNQKGYSLSTLQIAGREARGMSPHACNSIKTDRFEKIELRFPVRCAKVFATLLGQLRPADTKLTTTESHHVLYDGRIRVTLPTAPVLPEWPEPNHTLTTIQVHADDFKNAVGIISAQKAAKDADVSFAIADASETLTLSIAVPGGKAVVSCPVSSETRLTSEAIDLRLPNKTLGMFRSPNSDAIQLTIAKNILEIEQISANETRRMIMAWNRPQRSH